MRGRLFTLAEKTRHDWVHFVFRTTSRFEQKLGKPLLVILIRKKCLFRTKRLPVKGVFRTEDAAEHNYFQKICHQSRDNSPTSSPVKINPCIFPEPEWSSVIRRTLQEHPLGLTRSRLSSLCARKFNGASLKEKCPYETLDDLMKDNPGFLEQVSFPGLEMFYFLAKPDEPINMIRLLSRLRHNLQVILIQNGIMPARAFCENLWSEFGIKLEPRDWGFVNAEALVEFILTVHPGSYVRSIPVVRLEGSKTLVDTVLVYNDGTCPNITDYVQQEDAKILALGECQKMREYEGCYIRFGDKLDCIGDIVEEFNVHECYVGKIHTPLDFYMHLAELWDELEHYFQKYLNKYYVPARQGGILSKIPPKLQPNHLIPGMFAAAYFEKEWFRCVIKSYNETSQTCEIFSIDYGFVSTISIEHLRRLHHDVFRKMKAQAINCRFQLHPFHVKYLNAVLGASKEHRHDIVAMFQEIVKDKSVCTTFKNHVFLPEENDYIWEVEISIVKGYPERYLQISDEGNVWDVLLKQLQEKYPVHKYLQL
ncbi:unnamed protein product [Allacma fusca]|uniref:Tudor domain-containing protein n=1 Tax=Allacma fusca TaxID=39272 RepID=A0A8J2JX41_9HEXA|nr:unnamed protein product [Allacma fusca]